VAPDRGERGQGWRSACVPPRIGPREIDS
jgi:hypothetical protein